MSPARRKWGQHWLASNGLAERLVRWIDPRPGDRFLEIGPGQGRLTRPLLTTGAEVVAVEIDPRCARALQALPDSGRLVVVNADILQHPTLPWLPGTFRIVGNLPYNVSSPILRLTASHERVSDAHYMLQEEVAERVVAAPGSKRYGLLSVLVQWHFVAEIMQRLPPGSFRPPPRVSSAFIRLRRQSPVGDAPIGDHVRGVIEAAFAHRRKTLARALRHRGWPGTIVDEALARSGTDPRARAEQLTPEGFARLAAELPESAG